MKDDDRTLVFTRDKPGRVNGIDLIHPGDPTALTLRRL
jgi:hypothetical protein